jgi:hypothetical protein
VLNDAFEFGFGFELPSLEEIEEMDIQRSRAIESLEISEDEDGNSNSKTVKYQRCNNDVPIVAKSSNSGPRPYCNGRAATLQKRIKWMENYYHSVNININDLNALRQELAEILEQDAKLINLEIYHCIAVGSLTGWKFVCS